MFTSISEYLERSINKAGINQQIKAAQVCEFWQEVIEEIFTKGAARGSQAIKLKDGTLTVTVLSSVLAQEFKFKEEEIKADLNRKAGCGIVKKIRFEI
jgi:predicted nucleic acid-binding Zn ribbon protein